MICPNCMVQMHQYKKVGGGFSQVDNYLTWELKQCPRCLDLYVEYYSTFLTPSIPLWDFKGEENEQTEYVKNLIKEKINE